MEKFVKIPLKEYLDLKKQELQLLYLETCGVDNWDPGISKNNWAKEQGEESYESMLTTEKDCEVITE